MQTNHFAAWRRWAGLTQSQLGELVGLTKTTISRIERGARPFTSYFLCDFQRATGCPELGAPLSRPPRDEPPPTKPRRHFRLARERVRKGNLKSTKGKKRHEGSRRRRGASAVAPARS